MKRASSWSPEDEQFLRDNYRKMTYREMAKHLGRGEKAVKSRAAVLGIRKNRQWSSEDLQTLIDLYPDTPTRQLANRLGYGLTAVYGMAKKLGLKKSEAFNASDFSGRMTKENRIRRGLEHRFPKGHVPHNKGKRMPGWAPGRMAETQFKKGQRTGRANNLYQPIGTERVTKDGYLQRKINDDMPIHRRWQFVHRIVWEEHNGPIPAGHNVIFKDGNYRNFDIDNLELISRADWMKRHTFHNYPDEVREQIHMLAGFKRKLNRYAKK